MKNKYKIALLTIVTAVIITWAFARPYHFSGDCMEPTIKSGNTYFLNQMAPYLRPYRINDIIIFKHEGIVWVSRIVALENNTIQIAEGTITVNGALLENTGISRDWTGWNYGDYAINEPLQVPLGHVFILSDKLSAHYDDSRTFGPIAEKSILGVIWQ